MIVDDDRDGDDDDVDVDRAIDRDIEKNQEAKSFALAISIHMASSDHSDSLEERNMILAASDWSRFEPIQQVLLLLLTAPLFSPIDLPTNIDRHSSRLDRKSERAAGSC